MLGGMGILFIIDCFIRVFNINTMTVLLKYLNIDK